MLSKSKEVYLTIMKSSLVCYSSRVSEAAGNMDALAEQTRVNTVQNVPLNRADIANRDRMIPEQAIREIWLNFHAYLLLSEKQRPLSRRCLDTLLN